MLLSALGAVALLAFVLLRRRPALAGREAGGPPAADRPPRASWRHATLLALVAAVAGAALIALRAGPVAGVAVLVVARLGIGARPLHLAGAALLGVAVPLVYLALPARGPRRLLPRLRHRRDRRALARDGGARADRPRPLADAQRVASDACVSGSRGGDARSGTSRLSRSTGRSSAYHEAPAASRPPASPASEQHDEVAPATVALADRLHHRVVPEVEAVGDEADPEQRAMREQPPDRSVAGSARPPRGARRRRRPPRRASGGRASATRPSARRGGSPATARSRARGAGRPPRRPSRRATAGARPRRPPAAARRRAPRPRSPRPAPCRARSGRGRRAAR